MPYPNVHFVPRKKLKVVGIDVVSIVYRWGGIETSTMAIVVSIATNFYCLPLRRYWDPTVSYRTLTLAEYFYCLPLRRYWDPKSTIATWFFRFISIVYRWGGIETSQSCQCEYRFRSFLLSTAEAVLRRPPLRPKRSNHNISIVYRWGGIETPLWITVTSHAAVISIVYRWGGIETDASTICWARSIAFISIVYRWGGIETCHNCNNDSCNFISIVYRWGGIETSTMAIVVSIATNFYCLPLRRYWDP